MGVSLAIDRSEEIAELAEIVADDFSPKGAIDVERICDEMGLTFSYGRYLDYFDGLLEHKSNRFHIYCNLDRVLDKNSGRARFTVAHELGHYFIDEHRNALASGNAPAHPSFSDYESDLLVEAEADHFAANLLMPEQRFKQSCKKLKPGLESILELSQTFSTSVTSAALRYTKLDIVPCAIFKWSNNKLQWHWMSTQTFRLRLGTPLKDISALPVDSSTSRVARGETSRDKKWLQAGTTVSAWFRSVHSAGFHNDILIEQAISLGRYGVLSFIYPESGEYSGFAGSRFRF